MKKTLFVMVSLLFVNCVYAQMANHPSRTEEMTGIVVSFTQEKLILHTKKNNTAYYRHYRITGETRIIGEINKGATVKVTYHIKKVRRYLFLKTAVRIEVVKQDNNQNPLYSFSKGGYN